MRRRPDGRRTVRDAADRGHAGARVAPRGLASIVGSRDREVGIRHRAGAQRRVVIITRTPLRITLGGGGTDVPGYYRKHDGGFLIAAAITEYVFIAVNRNFNGDYLLKYSQIERFDDPGDAEHRLLREILLVTDVPAGVEISSMADIPAGTGLGSSGAFTVGALQALRAHR